MVAGRRLPFFFVDVVPGLSELGGGGGEGGRREEEGEEEEEG